MVPNSCNKFCVALWLSTNQTKETKEWTKNPEWFTRRDANFYELLFDKSTPVFTNKIVSYHMHSLCQCIGSMGVISGLACLLLFWFHRKKKCPDFKNALAGHRNFSFGPSRLRSPWQLCGVCVQAQRQIFISLPFYGVRVHHVQNSSRCTLSVWATRGLQPEALGP